MSTALRFTCAVLALWLAGCGDGIGVPIRRAALAPQLDADVDDDASRDEGDDDDERFDERCSATLQWPAASVEAEEELLAAINARRERSIRCGERERSDLAPLRLSSALRCSARLHSLDMVQRDFTGRTNPDGDGPRDRMRAAGFRAEESDESIVSEEGGADSALARLLDDWDDCMNVATDLTYIGIGRYEDRWTLDFASN